MISGYEGSSRNPLKLLQGRLGIYKKETFDIDDHTLCGIHHQSTRLQQAGGYSQQERMIRDKRRSLDHAVWYSYQAAQITHVNSENEQPVRALINPNKIKQDYDDKILSVGFEHNFKCGDVFKWIGTNTHWIIYLQDLTELAYFRGDIRRCSYLIKWEDEDGNIQSSYVALKGPSESKINSKTTHGISLDSPNYSLSLLVPKNDATLKYFKRYNKFYLQDNEICWRIEAVDIFSTPGIIEVHAAEYYANETEDDITNGIVGGLIEEVENPNNPNTDFIAGETFIKVKKTYIYVFKGRLAEQWSVDSKYPVKLEVSKTDPREVSLKWDSTFSGQFVLRYGQYEKTIIVESLF